MSSDWPEVSLESLKAGTKSAFAMGPFGSKIKAENFVRAGVPVIKGGNLGGTYLSETSFDFLTQEKASELASSKAGRLDIVVTHRGTLGQVGLIPESSKYEQYVVSQSQLKMSFDTEKVDPYYVYYFLRSPLGQSRLLANTSQVGVPAIAQALTTIRQLQIPLPPRDSQTEITATLRALDDRISLLRETNATLEAIAQALFKSWFVDFDPVRAKMEGRAPEGMDEGTAALFPDGFEESELGLVPRGWHLGKLADFVDSHGGVIQTGPFGSQLHASDYVVDGTPVVMPKDISLRRIDTRSVARVRGEDVERLSRHKLMPGDIVFSRRGDVERHAFITEAERGWLCGTGCLLIRPGAKNPAPTFLSLLLDTPSAKAWLVQHAVGATMPNLNTSILGSVPIVSPSVEALQAFEDVVSILEKSRSENAAQAQTLISFRDTLLPSLVSGQLRIPCIYDDGC